MAISDESVIDAAMPTNKDYKISDSGGLFLLVSKKGGKWWRLKYRIGGKEKSLSMGVYPNVSLADARTKRDEAKRMIAKGIDPSSKRKQEKLEKSPHMPLSQVINIRAQLDSLSEKTPGLTLEQRMMVEAIVEGIYQRIGKRLELLEETLFQINDDDEAPF